MQSTIEREDEILNEIERFEILDAAFDLVSKMKPGGAIQAILDQGREDARKAVYALVRCDPFDGPTVRELQWQVLRFDRLAEYIGSILEAGKFAHEDVSEEEAARTLRIIRGDDEPIED